MAESRTLRLAFGRFMQESNSFSSVLTRREDFERNHLLSGPDLLQACQPGAWEVKGFLKNLELSGLLQAITHHPEVAIEPVPLLSAWTISGGPLEPTFFTEICAEFCQRLREAGPVDGVFLALHGAMGVAGILDPEAHLLEAIRKVVGPIPIAVTFDLHANLTRAKFALADLICAYHTNPHYDMARTGYRAGKLLIRLMKGEIQPVSSWRSLPMLLGGGNTVTLLPPMRRIFKRLKRMEADPRVLSANLLMCHPYLNHPELGWAVQVSTDHDPALAEQLADELAEACWSVRHQLPPEFLSVEQMLKTVRKARFARKLGSVAVCDASDVVGAGGTGENTHLLKALIAEAPDLLTYYPLRDPVAVAELWSQPAHQTVTVSVGGKLQPEVNPALTVTGQIKRRFESDNFGRVLHLDLGAVQLVLTEGYAMPMKPAFYEDLGLKVREADMVITKNFFHFRLYYLAHSRRNLYVKTQGITDFERLQDVDSPYPAWPHQELSDWREVEAAKRGVSESRPATKQAVRLQASKERRWSYVALGTLALLGAAHLLYHRGLRPRPKALSTHSGSKAALNKVCKE